MAKTATKLVPLGDRVVHASLHEAAVVMLHGRGLLGRLFLRQGDACRQ